MKLKWKKRTVILLPLLVLLFIVGVAVCGLRSQHTKSDRLKDKSPKQYTAFQSSVDKDLDGIDDVTDMLQGALNYIKTEPKYKSKYYYSYIE